MKPKIWIKRQLLSTQKTILVNVESNMSADQREVTSGSGDEQGKAASVRTGGDYWVSAAEANGANSKQVCETEQGRLGVQMKQNKVHLNNET